MDERNPGTNGLGFECPWPKVKVTRRRKVKIVSAKNSVYNLLLFS